jgi:hypothetical protein
MLLSIPAALLLAIFVAPVLADPPPPALMASSSPAPAYVQLELTTVEVSAEERRQLGMPADAYPDVLADLQTAALAHKVALNLFAFPAFVAPDGTPAYLHLLHNERLTASSTMTVGAGVRMTPRLMPGGRILLGFALQTQRMEGGNRVDTEQIDLERVLHETQSQWIGECRQADGSDRLTYLEAHRLYVQPGETVPVKTQLLLLDHPSPFQSDAPNSNWTAARQTIQVTFMFIDTDEKALMAHFRTLSLGYSPPPNPPPMMATIEDGEDTVVSQSVPGAHSGDRTGADIRVLPHLKSNQTVQSAFSIKEYEPDLKHPGADGTTPTLVHTFSTTRTLPSGGFAVLGDYTTQDGITHEIDVQVEIVPLKHSIAASHYLSPPFKVLPSGAISR